MNALSVVRHMYIIVWFANLAGVLRKCLMSAKLVNALLYVAL